MPSKRGGWAVYLRHCTTPRLRLSMFRDMGDTRVTTKPGSGSFDYPTNGARMHLGKNHNLDYTFLKTLSGRTGKSGPSAAVGQPSRPAPGHAPNRSPSMAFLNALSDYGAAAATAVATVATAPSDTQAAPRTAPAGTEPRAPFFRWRDQWCVGIDALDRDRRAIAAIVNHIALRFGEREGAAIMQAPRTAGAPSALRYWLDALHERAREHFNREEALMRLTHYPDTAEHAGEHALMLAEYTALVRDIIARGDERLRLEDLEALKQWFMGHVLDMDKRLGRYLRANGISALMPPM